MRRLTPVGAIRKKCLDCSETTQDIVNCEFPDCPLYSFRMRHRPKGSSPARGIRHFCLWCGNGSALEVRLCSVIRCALYSYRFGRTGRKGRVLTLEQKNVLLERLRQYREGAISPGQRVGSG